MTMYTTRALFGAAYAVHQQHRRSRIARKPANRLGDVELAQLEAQLWSVELSIHQAELPQVVIPILVTTEGQPVLSLQLSPSLSEVRMFEVEGPQYGDCSGGPSVSARFLPWLREQDNLDGYKVPEDPRITRGLGTLLRDILKAVREER